MMENKYQIFSDFLKRNFKPINTKEKLEKMKNEYYNKFGAIKNAEKFFDEYVDRECKIIFAYAVRRLIGKIDMSTLINEDKMKIINEAKFWKLIKRNIKLFYDWRSKFVHSAKIPYEIACCGYGIFKNGQEVYTFPYKRKDFQLLFEHGFLRYFGFHDRFKHGDVGKKIGEYKQHTGIKIKWES